MGTTREQRTLDYMATAITSAERHIAAALALKAGRPDDKMSGALHSLLGALCSIKSGHEWLCEIHEKKRKRPQPKAK